MKLWQDIQRSMYPAGGTCLLCGRISRNGPLCSECITALRQLRLYEPLCPRCGSPLRQDRPCGCELPDYLTACPVWKYGSEAAELVQALKFGRALQAAEPLAQGMA